MTGNLNRSSWPQRKDVKVAIPKFGRHWHRDGPVTVTTRPGGPASRAQFIRATLVPDALRAVPELMPGIPVSESSAGPGPATRSHGLPLNLTLTRTPESP